MLTPCAPDSTFPSLSQSPAANDAAVLATDNCGGAVTVTHSADALTPGSCPGKIIVTRVYTAADASGNNATCTQTITVADTTPPVITQCAPDSTVQCAAHVPAANDARSEERRVGSGGGTGTHSADAITPGSCPGKFTLTRVYTAADACGNTA